MIPTTPIPEIDLAELCREIREEALLTQDEIGVMIGADARTVRRWEAGRSAPSGQFMAKLFHLRDKLRAPQTRRALL